ncbi:MAG TPA: chromosome segregation protein SMC, partial [Hyphomicrobiales bacterium]|nr:chromosome segregation protein SMC [Hyphomicrobiales bacterium]
APLAAAEAELNRHEAEAGTLERILAGASGRKFAPVVDRIKVAPGFEAALGAALGDDLEASLDAAAPARWTHLAGADAVEPLPDGADPLSARVEAPAELARRLARVGLVSRERGAALQARLSPGQRLVSREGDLWRWDGFTATAEAPTAATERLAQKNRLEAVLTEAALARATVGVLKETLAAAATSLADAVAAERARREAARAARTAEAEARAALARAERRQSEALARKEALDANGARLAAGIEEARAEVARAEAALAEAADPTDLQQRITVLRTEVANDRAGAAEARATADGLAREAGLRQQRLAAIERERSAWQARIANSQAHVATLAERRAAAAAEHEALAAAPDEFDEKRRALDASLGTAGATRRDAADRLAEAETGLAAADRAAREALAALSEAREGQARAEERLSAALERVREVEARIVETLEVEPGAVAALAGLGAEATLPPTAAVEDRLERLRQERERLGSVNLRAEDEVREIAERRDALVSERDDLVEAIRRLRQAIGSLNREGRERLLAAFEEVNGHFRDLFQKLFGGGTAELMLTESDDPLEAGLEIVARPPGKKPQTMTLLSGGEQALTAMSLIFAVFLTNPAPICVLDEVDAPLDDANVERFCNLVDEMT